MHLPNPHLHLNTQANKMVAKTTVDASEGASQSPRYGSLNALFELGEHPIDESPKLKVGFQDRSDDFHVR